MTKKLMYTICRAALACLLAMTIVIGLGAVAAPSALAADSGSGTQVTPTQVHHAEKPYVTIETNLVVDAAGNPTGYVELALKVRTPTLYYADWNMETPRFVGDGLENKGYDPFDPDDHSTYAITRQTTFSNVAVTLEYNSEELMPVSWEHTDEDSIEYPDFFFENYGHKLFEEDTNIQGHEFAAGIYKTSELDMQLGQDPNDEDIVPYYATRYEPEAVLADFNGRTSLSVAVPVLQDTTDITSAMAFVQGRADGASWLSIEVNSSANIAFPEETTLAVVRFRYLPGAEGIKAAIQPSDTGRIVDTTKFTSNHDELSGPATSLFRFAPDEVLGRSPVQQVLHYTSGYYVGHRPSTNYLGAGWNEFYATKRIYNGKETTIPEYTLDIIGTTPNYVESEALFYVAGDGLDLPLTGSPDVSNAVAPYFNTTDSLNRTTVAAKSTTVDAGEHGYYSYTSNLLFTSDTPDFIAYSNVRFTMAAEESYNAGGGTDIENVSTIVFLDWDDSILGALSVVKGDVREAVEAYVENFIHPSLRASVYKNSEDPGAPEMLKNLATSLERQYTYAGEYPNTVGGTAQDGVTTFPDGYEDADKNDLAGSSYPLTNKLDYAFLRRPVINSKDVLKSTGLYKDDVGNAVDAVEWTTGVVDWEKKTAEIHDDYFYIHGWALVEERNRDDATITEDVVSEDVWTTFSSAGELSEVHLPGYNPVGETDYDNLSYFNADYIAAADGTSDTALNFVGGTTSRQNTGERISFATYDESYYFTFANFKEVDADEMYVKACYEPGEDVSWSDNYIITSTEPYYVRYGREGATTDSGVDPVNSYAVIFEYERINAAGEGVLRVRDPYIRVLNTLDNTKKDETFVEGSRYYEGSISVNSDIIQAEILLPSTVYSIGYALVEVYGCDNFIASVNRSSDGNELDVLTNFNYLLDDSPQGHLTGFEYNKRLGSDGFVYQATLRQVLEEGLKVCEETSTQTIFNGYISKPTLRDLNLRLDKDGLEAVGTSTDVTLNFGDAQKAILDAIRIAYKYGKAEGVLSLNWHQLQYHIINTLEGGKGIDTGTGILPVELCGNYQWCRLDGCSERVTVEVRNLSEALSAVYVANDPSVSSDRQQAAIDALNKYLAAVLKVVNIVDASAVDNLTTRTEVLEKCAYTDSNAADLITKLAALIEQVLTDTPGFDYTALTAGQVQNWLATYDSTKDYTDPNPEGGADNTLKIKYWWLYWEHMPYEVDFDNATDADVVKLLVDAVFSEHEQDNVLAWKLLDELTDIDDFRFRASARGDFFSETYKTNAIATHAYDKYLENMYDIRTELVLKQFSSVDGFITSVKGMINRICDADNDGEWDEGVTKEDILEALDYSEESNQDFSWYQVQHYLIEGEFTDTPEYYAPLSGVTLGETASKGVYWWKVDDERLSENKNGNGEIRDETKKDEEIAADIKNYPYIGSTLNDLRTMLGRYVNAQGDTDLEPVRKAQFMVWFTPEVAADLILRVNTYGTIVDDWWAEQMAGWLLDAAVSAGDEIETIKWSQVQYAALNDNAGKYETLKAAQGTTFAASCDWGNGADDADSNRWREQKVEAITDLRVLLEKTKDGTVGSAMTDIKEFTITQFAFKIESLATNLADKTPAEIMSAIYTAVGTDKWNELINELPTTDDGKSTFESNLTPRTAWYLIQYYLRYGELKDNNFDATIEAAKSEFYWEYGWDVDQVTGVNQLWTAVTAGAPDATVPARIDRICSAAMTADFATVTNRIKGVTGWTDTGFKSALTAMSVTKGGAPASWWQQLQFVVLHQGAPNNADHEVASDYAETEGGEDYGNFYWWYSGTAPGLTTKLPDGTVGTSTDGTTNDGTSDDSKYREQAAKALLEAGLRKYATFNDSAGSIVTADNLKNYLNIRVKTDNVTDRDLLPTYSDTEVDTIFRALVAKLYEDNVDKTDIPLADTWDYVTTFNDSGVYDASGKYTAKSVYTYNEAAWNKVLEGLTAEQIQHWFETYDPETGVGSYSATDAAKGGYWWITASVYEDKTAAFKEFLNQIIGYSHAYVEGYNGTTLTSGRNGGKTKVSSALTTILKDNWEKFGFGEYTGNVLTYIRGNAYKLFFESTMYQDVSWLQIAVLGNQGLLLDNDMSGDLGDYKDDFEIPSDYADDEGNPLSISLDETEIRTEIVAAMLVGGKTVPLAESANTLLVTASEESDDVEQDDGYTVTADATLVSVHESVAAEVFPSETIQSNFFGVILGLIPEERNHGLAYAA